MACCGVAVEAIAIGVWAEFLIIDTSPFTQWYRQSRRRVLRSALFEIAHIV